MESTALLDAIEEATKDARLCPNRVWQVGSSLEGWESKLSGLLLPFYEYLKKLEHEDRSTVTLKYDGEKFKKLENEDHSACTYDFCEYSRRDFTAVRQRHELKSCNDFCFRIRELFRDEELVRTLSSESRLTPWALDGLSIIKHPRPFMAISHVWSDGTGNGAWPRGQVHECLYRFFRGIAEQFQCEGIWWDTVCIPWDKAARSEALNIMQVNYEYARITLVHDCFLRKLPWTGPGMACFAIVMSPWFSRGWTALELAKSRKVKVIFRDSIKDLDEDILGKVEKGNVAAKAIDNLRRPVDSIDELLATLGPRSTSWLKDQAKIAGLLAGIKISLDPPQGGVSKNDTFQRDIYQNILRKMEPISHANLFHKSATMSGGFSWCATSLFQLPQAPVGAMRRALRVNDDGEIVGEWKAVRIDNIPDERYIWGESHQLIEAKLRLALKKKSKCVLLVEPDAYWISRGLLVEPMMRPSGAGGPAMKSRFIGQLRFSPNFLADYMEINLTIGNTKGWKELDEQKNAWDVIRENKQELGSTIDGGGGQSFQPAADHVFTGNGKWTALHHAAWKCDLVMVKKHLEASKADLDTRDELGQSALHLAAERGNKDIVEALLKNNAKFDQHDDNEQTALHRAVWGGSEKVVEMLVQWPGGKSLINVQDDAGRTALHYAVEQGNKEIVTSLLVNGGDPNIQCRLDGQTALHRAIWAGSNEAVRILLRGSNGNRSDTTITDNEGRTALYYAAEQGNEAIIQLLGYKNDEATGANDALTALRWAAKSGNIEVVQLFLQSPIAKQAYITRKDDHGRTVLHWAAMGGSEAVLERVTSDGADVTATDTRGWTALHYAAAGGNEAAVSFCIAKGVEKEATTGDGWTALHLAAQAGRPGTVDTLIKEEVKKDARIKDDLTALHLAARAGERITAWVLMENGVDREARTSRGQTALHLAAQGGKAATVEALIERGAAKDAKTEEKGAKTEDRKTALHLAAEAGEMTTVAVLMENGVDKEATTGQGWTALHLAAWGGKTATVEMLVEKGAEKEAAGDSGRTALHLAAQNGQTAVVEALIKKRAAIEATMTDGQTALHLAAWTGQTATAMALIMRGAKKEAQTNRGLTPLHMAAQAGRTETVEMLIKEGLEKEARTNDDSTPLHLAAQAGQTTAAETLIGEGVNMEETTRYGESAFHLAAEAGRTGTLEMLMKNEVKKEARTKKRRTALHLAAMRGKVETLETLLKNNVNRDAIADGRETALHSAAETGMTEAAKMLIENGIDKDARKSFGETALHVAAKAGKTETAKMLIDMGLEKDAITKDGLTALQLAAKEGHGATVTALIGKGLDKNVTTADGKTLQKLEIESRRRGPFRSPFR